MGVLGRITTQIALTLISILLLLGTVVSRSGEAQTLTTVHNFRAPTNDGASPFETGMVAVRRGRGRSVSHGAVFVDASTEKGRGGPDGIKVDKQGNLYGAGPGGVWIISPSGKHLVTIEVPETVGNLTWGDKDGKSLYITASTSIYRIRLNIPGIIPANP